MTDCCRRCSIKVLASTMPLVGLQGHLGQQLDGLPVVAHGKGLEAEHRLQFDRGARAGSAPAARIRPSFDADLELVGDQFQQGRKRRLIDARDDTGKAQVTELHGEASRLAGPRRCRMMERSVSLNV